MIELKFYHKNYLEVLQSFSLPEEQQQFTALPSDALEKCAIEHERKPVVILAEGIPVGFFVLHTGEEIRRFTDNPGAILVRALSVNHIYQGKGFAKRAMIDLPDFVRENFNDINEIVLAVNMRNINAKEMYLKAGCIDKGIRNEGRIGIQYILHYDLN